jgi:hypothetical protein
VVLLLGLLVGAAYFGWSAFSGFRKLKSPA